MINKPRILLVLGLINELVYDKVSSKVYWWRAHYKGVGIVMLS